jgi:hypothetical protein
MQIGDAGGEIKSAIDHGAFVHDCFEKGGEQFAGHEVF